ncbi:MAG: hypothetical protein JWP91_3889 [Fibrobacteres bacterium]|nr:hypothetical protein [Fibrobacterota bacterium]
MGYLPDHSRSKRPLWEMLVMILFFLGLAIMARVPAEIGKYMAKAAAAQPREIQANSVQGE